MRLLCLVVVSMVALSLCAQTSSEPQKKAYIIAMAEYSENSGWTSLQTERDVYYLEKSFEILGFSSENIRTFYDQKTTKADAIQILEEIVSDAVQGDFIHVHYTGHMYLIDKVVDSSKIRKIKELEEEYERLQSKRFPYSRFPYLKPDLEDSLLVQEINVVQSEIFTLKYDKALAFYNANYNKGRSVAAYRSDYLSYQELTEYLHKLSSKIGLMGQIVLSIEGDFSGPDEYEIAYAGNTIIANRGGVYDISKLATNAPIVILTSAMGNQLSYYTNDGEGKTVGPWAYAFYKSVSNESPPTYLDLAEWITLEMKSIAPRQTPTVAGNLSLPAYKVMTKEERQLLQSNPDIQDPIEGDVYVLSIGISNYSLSRSNMSFANAASDAARFSEAVQRDFEQLKGSNSLMFVKTLLNEQATKDGILLALNEVVSKSKPEDYFLFCFSGMSAEIEDSTEQRDIYFFPYLTYDISTNETLMPDQTVDMLGMKQFRDLLEFIAAENQLIVTEAGSTPNFQKIFARTLIESSPTIADLSQRNRVLIVPRTVEYDQTLCQGKVHNQAPISYYVDRVSEARKNSIFDLFDSNQRKYYEYDMQRVEMECGQFLQPYTTVFYERDFIEDLQFFSLNNGQSRGLRPAFESEKKHLSRIAKKHALIIGVNDYGQGAPTWGNLENPIEDAKDIEQILREQYRYETRLMLNTAGDSILTELKRYSRILDENDQFVFFIAGHGDYDPYFFDDGFLVLSNSLSHSKDPNRRTYLPFSQLKWSNNFGQEIKTLNFPHHEKHTTHLQCSL